MEWKQLMYQQHADPVETTTGLSSQLHHCRQLLLLKCVALGDTSGNENKYHISLRDTMEERIAIRLKLDGTVYSFKDRFFF